ncbi:hypothetical protein ON010_g5057 [Phytophthora cinnamomi]|nr:hypothetical protein ON010_g5057 [Phytophthora cinnamomi]
MEMDAALAKRGHPRGKAAQQQQDVETASVDGVAQDVASQVAPTPVKRGRQRKKPFVMQMRAEANREPDGVSREAPTTVRRGRSRRNLQEQERGVCIEITTARTSAVARKRNGPAGNQESTSKKRRMHSSASVALETAATTYNAVGGYPTTITSYADRRLSPIVDSESDVSISDGESSSEEEYGTIEDANQLLVHVEKNNRKRAEVLATAVDVNICRPEDRVNYNPDFEEDIRFVDTSATWTDAALADYMAEAGGDMSDDDALLKIAKKSK